MHGIKHSDQTRTGHRNNFDFCNVYPFFPFFLRYLPPRDWWSRYSDVHVGCITRPLETCSVGALKPVDRHSPFVRDADRKFSFLWYGQNDREKKRKREREERTEEKFKCGEKWIEKKKKRLVTRLWEWQAQSRQPTRAFTLKMMKNKNRLKTASHASPEPTESGICF